VNKYKAENIPEEDKGFRYRIPVRTLVKFVKTKVKPKSETTTNTEEKPKPDPVTYEEMGPRELVATNTLTIAQFGTVATLPASLGPGETIYLISLYPDTGALKSIDTTSSTINPETLGKLGTAAGSFIKSTRKPEEDEKTAIEKKEEEKTERELDVAIELLKQQQKDLGILEETDDDTP